MIFIGARLAAYSSSLPSPMLPFLLYRLYFPPQPYYFLFSVSFTFLLLLVHVM